MPWFWSCVWILAKLLFDENWWILALVLENLICLISSLIDPWIMPCYKCLDWSICCLGQMFIIISLFLCWIWKLNWIKPFCLWLMHLLHAIEIEILPWICSDHLLPYRSLCFHLWHDDTAENATGLKLSVLWAFTFDWHMKILSFFFGVPLKVCLSMICHIGVAWCLTRSWWLCFGGSYQFSKSLVYDIAMIRIKLPCLLYSNFWLIHNWYIAPSVWEWFFLKKLIPLSPLHFTLLFWSFFSWF